MASAFWTSRKFLIPLIILLSCLSVALLAVSFIRLGMDKDHIANMSIVPWAETVPPKTKYPIIFHHGIYPLYTMHKFARDLRAKGYEAYSVQIRAADSIAVRTRELAILIDAVLRGTGAKKVNIIAHSMGGIDARFLISSMGYGDRVASLSTLGSPHHGASLVKFIRQNVPPWLISLFDFFVGSALDGSTWFTVDSRACFKELAPKHMKDVFNPANQDDPRVYYQSWAGVSGPPSDVPSDPIHFWSSAYVLSHEGLNDGIVSVESAKWGIYRGELRAAHSALIGRENFGIEWDYQPFVFFPNLAAELAGLGF